MKSFAILAFAAIFNTTKATPDFPVGSICCRAYSERRYQGEHQDFCITEEADRFWMDLDLEIDVIGSYECMEQAEFSFCQSQPQSGSCAYQSNLPAKLPIITNNTRPTWNKWWTKAQ